MQICAMPCFFRCHYISLHIDTLIFPAIILKIVGLHDLSLRAAWACHWLLCWLKNLRDKSWKETIFKVSAQQFNVHIFNVHFIYLYCLRVQNISNNYKNVSRIMKILHGKCMLFNCLLSRTWQRLVFGYDTAT